MVADSPLIRPANPSMGLRRANTTSSASFQTALGDSTSVAGTVLSYPDELFVFHRLCKLGEFGAGD